MSSSDARRGAVLGADALLAFGVADAAAWHPLELAAGAVVPGARPMPDDLDDARFDAFDLAALDDVASPAHALPTVRDGDAWTTDDAFADGLPDFLTVDDVDVASAASPELSLARERALRDEHARAHEAHVAAEAMRHEQELADAYAAGISAGQAEGAAAAERLLEDALNALYAAQAQLHAHEERWLSHLQENVAVLAVGVARHVIGREVATDDALVQARVAAAIAEFPLDHPLSMRVHPADLDVLKAAFDLTRTAGSREMRWTADDRVARGGALVEGRERIVDGRVDSALERVYRQLSGQHA